MQKNQWILDEVAYARQQGMQVDIDGVPCTENFRVFPIFRGLNLHCIFTGTTAKLLCSYLGYNQLTSLKMNKCKKLQRVDLTGHMVKKLKIDLSRYVNFLFFFKLMVFTGVSLATNFCRFVSFSIPLNFLICSD